MSLIDGVILGLVQGLTEFLPVSSSGHLAIIQRFINFQGPALVFDSLLHLGTLFAVIFYFRREIGSILRSLWRWARRGEKDEYVVLSWYLLVATIPAGIAGFTFEKFFSESFGSIAVVGAMLLATGTILWLAEGHTHGSVNLRDMSLADSLFVGLAQMAAIMPGLSRSGATIAAGMWRGLAHEDAARFSFLLSIPAIIGAAGYELMKTPVGRIDIAAASAGMLTAAVSGLAAIALLMDLIRRQRLRLFSVYCFIIGGIAIAASFSV